ncbi:unnamed protein product [Clonostachys solani]|uniref:Uncharacterized protein n=1 Tax=Clonostachys solani TaxID=160281 RepID=A0A9P0EJY2_9HYPO|nr:unnamed protein product [Clonostachys solani]
MAEGRPLYHDNEAEPFKSVVYLVCDGASGLQKFDLLMHHHDMVIAIAENEVEKAHVLHLQNIRKDTLSEAETAINNFLDKFEPLGDGDTLQNTTLQNTVFQNFGLVCDLLDELDEDARCEIEKVKKKLSNIENDSLHYPKRVKDTTPGKFNPVSEMIAACSDFLDQAESIMSKAYENACGYRPGRDGEIWMTDSYLSHQCLRKYLGEQSEIRDLTFRWETRVNKSSTGQRTFDVCF